MADSLPTKAASASVHPSAAETVVGQFWRHYRLTSRIGQGGMGTVYAAHDTMLDRRVAIKVISPENLGNEVSRGRFLREARAAASVSHPRLVTVHEVDEHDTTVFLVLEYLPGGSVSDLLRRVGHLDWRMATRLAIEVCQGLEACHARGIVHRDIKPANILLGDEAASFVKLSDFGLAKLLDAHTTMTGSHEVLGTPAFMSPEQCRAEPVDARTDVYSLGAAYYAMLTGKPPFGGDVDVQVMFGHCSKPIPNPCDIVPDLPAGCHQVIRRAMAKQPFNRYRSATDMRIDLERLLSADVPSAAPSVSRQRRWLVTNAGLAMLVCAGLFLIAWSVWQPRSRAPAPSSIPEVFPPVVVAQALPVAADRSSSSDSDGVWTIREQGSPFGSRDNLVARDEVHSLAMAPDGRLLAWGTGGASASSLNAVNWPSCEKAYEGDRGRPFDDVQAMTFTPDGILLIAAGEAVFAVDLAGKQAWKLVRISNGRVRAFAVRAQGDQTLVACAIEHWDKRGGVDLYSLVREPHPRLVGAATRLVSTDAPTRSVAFSDDGRWLAAAGEDAMLRVWAEDDWRQVATCPLAPERSKGHPGGSFGRGVCFSPDSQWLVAAADRQVLRWRVGDWSQPMTIRNHRETVTSVAFSPVADRLASGAVDEVLLGGYRDTNAPLTRFMGHHGYLTAVTFSPDGRFLISAGFDKRIRVDPVAD